VRLRRPRGRRFTTSCTSRSYASSLVSARDALERTLRERALVGDVRNLVPVAFACHGQHHSRQAPLDLRVLPDSVFEFAAEVLGPGPAWSYLDRRYRGRDPRMDAMLRADEAATVTGTERKERP
jgi:hypothetical protein